MKLIKLSLKDFRGYGNIKIDFNESLNVIIGRNDVGKSTILDALNYFFNDEQKMEPLDCNINSDDKIIEISASFKINNDDLVLLDATNPTSLQDEFLLNDDGNLEIKKIINASSKTITAKNVSVVLVAKHPDIHESPLITLNITSLRKLLNEHQDQIPNYEDINKSKKADMRKALFSFLITEETAFDTIEIPLKELQDENVKSWVKVKENLPLFNLFQSDRTNTDGDKEVQDPMKAITKEVLLILQPELDKIRDKVVKRVEEVGRETIEKLKELNDEIANQLTTIPELKEWDSIFKFSLDTDDEIPLNKRGSGVRRLILLSYFRAQAEKSSNEHSNNNIIYAIEEPETSQHPDYQQMIIDALKEISQQENSQVFITTHTPEIAQMVEKKSLVMISKDERNNPSIIEEEEIKMRKIVDTLGILPTISSRMVICLEGGHDVNFIKNINNCIPEFKSIIDLSNPNISLYALGGSRLIDWVNMNHFNDSNIKEFHLYDGDIQTYKKAVDEMNVMNDGRRYGVYTSMREMENYIPIPLIEEEFGCNLSSYKKDWEQFDVPDYLFGVALQDIPSKNRENAIKGILNARLTKQITPDLLQEHGVYNEIKDWFVKMNKIFEGTSTEVKV